MNYRKPFRLDKISPRCPTEVVGQRSKGKARTVESKRLVYVNDEFVPESQVKVSIFDSALMFGDMVFEMMESA